MAQERTTVTPEPLSVPVASIVIVAHNSVHDLPACLQALAGEKEPPHEVIVVDNASADGSAVYVAQAYPQVRLVRSAANLGYGGGANLGAAAAQGDYLIFLNADITAGPGWLRPLLDPLAADPDLAMTTPKILLAETPDRINTCGNEVHLTGLTLCRGMGERASAFSAGEEVAAVSGAAFAIRKSVFDALGGFDPRFFLYVEDTDLSLRARLAGFRIRYVPESVVFHRYQLRFGPGKVYWQERNRYLMLLKVYRPRTLVLLLPALLLAELVSWGFVLLRERGQVGGKLRAYLWPVAHRRELAAARLAAQRLRRTGDRSLLEASGYRLDFVQTGDTIAAHSADAVFTPVFRALRTLALRLEQ